MRINNQDLSFKPTVVGMIATLVCIPLFIHFGLWQYGKAQKQQLRQTTYLKSDQQPAAMFPIDLAQLNPANIADWQYKKVSISGEYDTRYQFLLDNQVHQTRAGYHVITPLKVAGATQYVLVNRGWLPANAVHTEVPVFETPNGLQEVVGQVWVPSDRYFTLEASDAQPTAFKKVWQYIDLKKYQQTVPFKVSPLLIKLDANSDAGGFARAWTVSFKRIATHMSYAYQWFGFAVATFLIFIYMSMQTNNTNNKYDGN